MISRKARNTKVFFFTETTVEIVILRKISVFDENAVDRRHNANG